jgi:hypothetical protein
MRVTGLAALRHRGYLAVALRTNEPCRATVRAPRFRAVSANLVVGTRTVVRLRRERRGPRRIAITVRALDAAGNLATLRHTVTAR